MSYDYGYSGAYEQSATEGDWSADVTDYNFTENAEGTADYGNAEYGGTGGDDMDYDEEIDEDYLFAYDDDHQFYCKVCDCTMNGPTLYKAHLDGNRHKKNVRNLELGVPITQSKRSGGGGYNSDLPVMTLKDAVPVKWTPMCQDALDNHQSPLIGLQYVIEFRHKNPLVEPKYFCEVCGAKCDIRMLVVHLTSVKHRLAYLKAYYPEMAEMVKTEQRKTEQAPLAERAAVEIETLEGRRNVQVRAEGLRNRVGPGKEPVKKTKEELQRDAFRERRRNGYIPPLPISAYGVGVGGGMGRGRGRGFAGADGREGVLGPFTGVPGFPGFPGPGMGRAGGGGMPGPRGFPLGPEKPSGPIPLFPEGNPERPSGPIPLFPDGIPTRAPGPVPLAAGASYPAECLGCGAPINPNFRPKFLPNYQLEYCNECNGCLAAMNQMYQFGYDESGAAQMQDVCNPDDAFQLLTCLTRGRGMGRGGRGGGGYNRAQSAMMSMSMGPGPGRGGMGQRGRTGFY